MLWTYFYNFQTHVKTSKLFFVVFVWEVNYLSTEMSTKTKEQLQERKGAWELFVKYWSVLVKLVWLIQRCKFLQRAIWLVPSKTTVSLPWSEKMNGPILAIMGNLSSPSLPEPVDSDNSLSAEGILWSLLDVVHVVKPHALVKMTNVLNCVWKYICKYLYIFTQG